MFRKLLQSISQNENLVYWLKVAGWVLAITAIVVTTVMMKDQEISFVYNNF